MELIITDHAFEHGSPKDQLDRLKAIDKTQITSAYINTDALTDIARLCEIQAEQYFPITKPTILSIKHPTLADQTKCFIFDVANNNNIICAQLTEHQTDTSVAVIEPTQQPKPSIVTIYPIVQPTKDLPNYLKYSIKTKQVFNSDLSQLLAKSNLVSPSDDWSTIDLNLNDDPLWRYYLIEGCNVPRGEYPLLYDKRQPLKKQVVTPPITYQDQTVQVSVDRISTKLLINDQPADLPQQVAQPYLEFIEQTYPGTLTHIDNIANQLHIPDKFNNHDLSIQATPLATLNVPEVDDNPPDFSLEFD